MLAASFVLVVELLENLAFLANASNLVSYLRKYMHFAPSKSANSVTNFMGTTFLLALLGGFLSDAFFTTYHIYMISAVIEFLVLAFNVAVNGGTKVSDKEFVVTTELLWRKLLKLDGRAVVLRIGEALKEQEKVTQASKPQESMYRILLNSSLIETITLPFILISRAFCWETLKLLMLKIG